MTVAMSGTGDVYHFKASFLATRFIWLFELLLSHFVYFLFQFCFVDNDIFFLHCSHLINKRLIKPKGQSRMGNTETQVPIQSWRDCQQEPNIRTYGLSTK
jgi:hypothetical protein